MASAECRHRTETVVAGRWTAGSFDLVTHQLAPIAVAVSGGLELSLEAVPRNSTVAVIVVLETLTQTKSHCDKCDQTRGQQNKAYSSIQSINRPLLTP